MTHKPMTVGNLNFLLAYLADEIETAETRDDLTAILNVLSEMLSPPTLRNTVTGLDHIRAEVDRDAIARAMGNASCIVKLELPDSLSETFQELSQRMRLLQSEDPETFKSASNALEYLAQGEIIPN